MKTISTSELRSKTRSLARSLARGKAVGLSYRGQKLSQIFPVRHSDGISANDPLYRFHRYADAKVKPLTDREIDRMIYDG